MDILESVKARYDEMVAVRRHMHEYPESSNEEFETMKYLEKKLDDMGIEWVEVEKGGIFGFINKGKPGPCVMLRTDIDALEIPEDPNNLVGPKVCVSKIPGKSHTCGHDAHMAMLLCEADVLNQMRDQLPGSVILMFERGEEGTGNAAYLFRYLKAHKELHVDCAYGCHVKWDLPTGKVVVQDGPMLSGVGSFRVTMKGKFGHGSRPDLANNPIDCFNAIYNGTNVLRMKYITPFHPLTISFGEVSCGNRINVIAGELFFQGTYRYYDLNDGEAFRNRFFSLIENECAYYDMDLDYNEVPRYLPVNNPKASTEILRRGVAKYVGEEVITGTEPWMGSESFGCTMAMYPGVFSFVGCRNDELGSGAGHHTPQFDVDERCMVYGAAAAIGFTLQFMEEKPDLWKDFTPGYTDCEDLIKYCAGDKL